MILYTIIKWYMILSYLFGLLIFVVDTYSLCRMVARAKKLQKTTTVDLSRFTDFSKPLTMGIVIFWLSPLTTWHGLLHYAAKLWCKLNNQPFKPWI
jgi:endonuclease III-like uncharacterized protein